MVLSVWPWMTHTACQSLNQLVEMQEYTGYTDGNMLKYLSKENCEESNLGQHWKDVIKYCVGNIRLYLYLIYYKSVISDAADCSNAFKLDQHQINSLTS